MVKNIFILIGLISILIIFITCTKPPQYPIEPVITFKGLSKNVMKQGFGPSDDKTYATIGFTDGDGDIGAEKTEGANVFIKDLRQNVPQAGNQIPIIPLQGVNNGISGEITIEIPTACCIFPDASIPCTPSTKYPLDTVVYELYIKDRAGHQSNAIKLTPIILECK